MVDNEADDRVVQATRHWHEGDLRQICHALFDLQTKCLKVAAALTDGLPIELGAAASELAAAWFDATDALRVGHRALASTPDAKHKSMLVLRVTHQVLFEIFELQPLVPATEQLRLRAALQWLSSRIGRALGMLAEQAPNVLLRDGTEGPEELPQLVAWR
jgi:hypothetical protein